MSDSQPIRAPAATPAVPAGGSRAAPPPPAPVSVVVDDPPPQLQAAPRGSVILATTGQPLPDGRTPLHLAAPQRATLPVLLANPLPAGTTVQLRIAAPGVPTRLVVLPPLPSLPNPAPAAPAGAPAAGAAPPPLTPGDVVRGTVQPLPARPTLPGLPAWLRPSTPSAAPTLPAGPAIIRILAIHPPATGGGKAPANPTPTSPSPAPNTVAGVLRQTPGNATVVRTPAAAVTLPQPVNAPPGSQVVLRLDPLGAPPALAGAPAPLAALSAALPGLPATLDVLATANPLQAAHIRENVVPTTGPRLTTGLMFFLAAVNRADFAGWLGEAAARALQQLPPEALVPRLAEEFTQLARAGAEPLPGEWRALPVPLLHGDEFHHLRLFIQDGDDADADQQGDTRFVIEAELSRLGPFQLDGVVHGPSQFDLTLRTTSALAPAVQSDLSGLFAAAGAAANFAGTLTFEVLPVLTTPAVGDAPATTGGVVV